jgi:diadenosine tetraphosphate (Ap4A) HIT family hydrolase
MEHWKEDRVGAAERGENPTVLARMRTGWAVIGDIQHLPGYCLLLYAGTANHLTDLPRDERARFLLDLSLLGEAVETACGRRDKGFRRLNYEVLGNSWEHLHGHVHPRYDWEPPEFLHGPVWRYGDERTAAEHRLGPEHETLRADIAQALTEVLADAYERH